MKARTKSPTVLFDFIKTTIGTASATKVRKMIKHGSVKVDGQIVLRPDTKLRKGQTVEITREKTAGKIKKVATDIFPYRVIYEDAHLIAIIKPAGLIASGKPGGSRTSFSQHVVQHFQFKKDNPCQAYPVKRLDKELSGIMLFAKSAKLKERMRKSWAEEVEVRFCALVEGKVREPQGKLKHFLQRKKSGISIISSKGPLREMAITGYKELKQYPAFTLLELRPETEVKHQERAQLAEKRNPIVGDLVYGAHENPFGRLAMHLHHISLNHPVSQKRLKITTQIPKQFMQFAKNA